MDIIYKMTLRKQNTVVVVGLRGRGGTWISFLLRRLLTTQHQRTFPAKAGVPSLLHLLTVVDDLATLAHYFASEVVSTSLISYSDCKCVLNGNLVSTR